MLHAEAHWGERILDFVGHLSRHFAPCEDPLRLRVARTARFEVTSHLAERVEHRRKLWRRIAGKLWLAITCRQGERTGLELADRTRKRLAGQTGNPERAQRADQRRKEHQEHQVTAARIERELRRARRRGQHEVGRRGGIRQHSKPKTHWFTADQQFGRREPIVALEQRAGRLAGQQPSDGRQCIEQRVARRDEHAIPEEKERRIESDRERVQTRPLRRRHPAQCLAHQQPPRLRIVVLQALVAPCGKGQGRKYERGEQRHRQTRAVAAKPHAPPFARPAHRAAVGDDEQQPEEAEQCQIEADDQATARGQRRIPGERNAGVHVEHAPARWREKPVTVQLFIASRPLRRRRDVLRQPRRRELQCIRRRAARVAGTTQPGNGGKWIGNHQARARRHNDRRYRTVGVRHRQHREHPRLGGHMRQHRSHGVCGLAGEILNPARRTRPDTNPQVGHDHPARTPRRDVNRIVAVGQIRPCIAGEQFDARARRPVRIQLCREPADQVARTRIGATQGRDVLLGEYDPRFDRLAPHERRRTERRYRCRGPQRRAGAPRERDADDRNGPEQCVPLRKSPARLDHEWSDGGSYGGDERCDPGRKATPLAECGFAGGDAGKEDDHGREEHGRFPRQPEHDRRAVRRKPDAT